MNRKIIAILSIAIAVLAVFAAANAANIVKGVGYAGTIYTNDNAAISNNILYYYRAPDGALTYGGSVATGGAGTGSALASQGAVVLTNNGRFLLTVDAGSNQISVFTVSNGVPTLYNTYSSLGSGSIIGNPISLAVYNNLVYVLNAGPGIPNAGTIAGFTLSNSGTLTYIAGSSQTLTLPISGSAEQIGFSPNGKVLVVTETGGVIDTFTVNYMGVASAPMALTPAGAGPYGFAFTGQNILVDSEAGTNTVSSYVVSDQGTLTIIAGAMPTFGTAPCWLAINNAGNFAYTSNAHGGTISLFAVAPNGELTLLSSVAAHTNTPTLDLAFSSHSQFLYVLNGGYITGFQVHPDGSLSQVTTINTNTGSPSSATGLAAT